jgi:site-specific DNA-methyltransferase (adenine-specific)
LTPPRPRKRGTSTSPFGAAGRVSHNSSAFYHGRLYEGVESGRRAEARETPLPPEATDQVFCASSEAMTALPDESVHLMVTSPPYNVGKTYDQDLTIDEYRAFLRRVWSETLRVLVPGGRAAVNIANLGRKPYLPLHAYLLQDMLALGFHMRGEIIWDKAASSAGSTAWGSWRSPSNPTLRDTHEYILIFCKESFRRTPPEPRTSTINREQFLEYTRSVWTFPAESARKLGHPAPFPLELPARLIQLYTYAGEVVLDPFMGSGQTAIAAIQAGRRFAGYEINPDYVELARGRIAAAVDAAANAEAHEPSTG